MRRHGLPIVVLIASTALLSACGRYDTYNRPYVWHPTHANTANLAAQVANPQDLVVGRGDIETDASQFMPDIATVESGTSGKSSLGGGGAGAKAGGS
ncbi:MAG: hypothetical protein KGI51_09620 [Rhodospirillales bacterium]|nr:hypothetical protein [Rhodospirillales bacterium]